MKYLLLSILTLSFYVSNAQMSLSDSSNKTQSYTDTLELFDLETNVLNKSTTDSLFVNWTITIDTLMSSWGGFSICDNENCFADKMSGTLKLKAGGSSPMILKPNHYGNEFGKEVFTMKFQDAKGIYPMKKVTYTFILKKNVVSSISNNTLADFIHFEGTKMILDNSVKSSTIQLFDINGKSLQFEHNNNIVSLEKYNNQLIFIQVKNENELKSYKVLVP
jgi:hypothetical protein